MKTTTLFLIAGLVVVLGTSLRSNVSDESDANPVAKGIRVSVSKGSQPAPAVESIETPQSGDIRHILRIRFAGPPTSQVLDRVSISFWAIAELYREVYKMGKWTTPGRDDVDGQGKPFTAEELGGRPLVATEPAWRSAWYDLDAQDQPHPSAKIGDSDKNEIAYGNESIDLDLDIKFDPSRPKVLATATFRKLKCRATWECKVVAANQHKE